MYSAQKTDKGISQGQIWVQVTYVDDTDKTATFQEVYRATRLQSDWPDSAILGRLEELNALDLSQVDLGTAKTPSQSRVPTKTQAEIDEEAFAALCQSYRITKMKFDAQQTIGLSLNVSQKDIDAIVAEIQATYQAGYEPMIMGLF